ncbi:MAG TPA: hypothetical protein VGJ97_09990 [Anaerolineaceae bacterium]|jgi:tetratricopeptide (TPR) repeat protein
MPRKEKPILEIPQTDGKWYCAVRRLRLWVEDEKDPDRYIRPTMLVVIDMQRGEPVVLNIAAELPTPAEIQAVLFEAMRHPQKEFGIKPQRPAEIHVEDQALVSALEAHLAEAHVRVLYQPALKNMDEFIRAVVDEINAGEDIEEIPGLLTSRGVTPELVGRVFEAAAAFYKAQPWTAFGTLDLFSIRVGRQKEPYYVLVMGAEGEGQGLMVFKTIADLHAVFSAEEASEIYGKGLRDVFFFNPPPAVSFDDQEAVEQYGWPLPAPDLYPTPLTYHGSTFGRPKADMLRWYEGVLRAIPAVMQGHLQTDADGNHPVVETDLEIPTPAGKLTAHVIFPAADLSQYEGVTPPWTLDLLEDDLDEAEEDLFGIGDRELIPLDSDLAQQLLNQFGEEPGVDSPPRDSALGQAQVLMYDAWEETNPKRRVAMAHKALKLSPNCADAYSLLAEDEAKSPQEALRFYQEAIQAGRRALGEEFLNDPRNAGAFWGLLETRPFMRAMAGYADTAGSLERSDEAEKIYREMLRLNPGDNQGVRYPLLTLLMSAGRMRDVETLLGEYEGDWTPDWAYTIALLTFRKQGASAKAKKELAQALEVNPYVPDYLTGKKRIPTQMPEMITMGGEDQAYVFAADHRRFWRETPGAIEWLEGSSVQQPGKTRRKTG